MSGLVKEMIDVHDSRRYFWLGYDACLQDLTESDNPYPSQSVEGLDWLDGYCYVGRKK